MIQFTKLPLAALEPNTGQIEGLPSNPRQWTQKDIDKIAKSLKETPELFEARPIIVYPHGGKYIILGGNLRYAGSMKDGNPLDEVPVAILPEDTTVEKMMEIVVKDNVAIGSWDYDALANEWDVPLLEWGVPAWNTETDVSPDDFGEDFSLPDEDKAPFRQVSFQLSNEMAETLLLAVKAAQYSDEYYQLVGDDEDANANGVAVYLLAKEWADEHLTEFSDEGFEKAEKEVEEVRQYLREALRRSGKKAVDVDNHLGTNGMSGHYFGSSQWLFPTRKAYNKMKEIMPLERDYYECKKIEQRYNLLKTLQEYRKRWAGLKK